MLKVIDFSNKPIKAEPIKDTSGQVISSGKAYSRIRLLTADQKEVSIRTMSDAILNKPKISLLDRFLNFFGLRKVAILKVEKNDGSIGYVVVNAESLRKRLNLGKNEFYKELSKKNGEITEYVEKNSPTPAALTRLGFNYYNGTNEIKADRNKAFKLFQEAAAKDFSDAHMGLAYCYSNGQGAPQDSNKALEHIEAAYRTLNPELRESFLQTMSHSNTKEFGLFLDRHDDILRMYTPHDYVGLELPFDHGIAFIDSDPIKAYNLLKSTRQSNLCMTLCHLKGIGVDANEEEAKKFIKQLIGQLKAQPHTHGYINWGDAIIKIGLNKIRELCQSEPELYHLFWMKSPYWAHSDLDEKTKKEYAELLQQGVSLKEPGAIACLIASYRRGINVQRDPTKAEELQQTLAEVCENDATKLEQYNALIASMVGPLYAF